MRPIVAACIGLVVVLGASAEACSSSTSTGFPDNTDGGNSSNSGSGSSGSGSSSSGGSTLQRWQQRGPRGRQRDRGG